MKKIYKVTLIADKRLELTHPVYRGKSNEVKTWQYVRNDSGSGADWQFTTEDARIKLKRLYTQFYSPHTHSENTLQ